MTWYADHGWDLSPGYEVNNSHFNRPVVSECLFCHANRELHVEGTANQYQPPIFAGHAIGCQRVHGPGELHVASRENGGGDEAVAAGPDFTIVNPAHRGYRRCTSPSVSSATSAAWCASKRAAARARIFGRGCPGRPSKLFSSGGIDRLDAAGQQRARQRASRSLRRPCRANTPERLLHGKHGKAWLHFVPRPASIA